MIVHIGTAESDKGREGQGTNGRSRRLKIQDNRRSWCSKWSWCYHLLHGCFIQIQLERRRFWHIRRQSPWQTPELQFSHKQDKCACSQPLLPQWSCHVTRSNFCHLLWNRPVSFFFYLVRKLSCKLLTYYDNIHINESKLVKACSDEMCF